MNFPLHVDKIHAVTYGSAGATFVIWGLHLSDVAAIVSASVAIIGLGVQIWVARTKVRLMKQRMQLGDGD